LLQHDECKLYPSVYYILVKDMLSHVFNYVVEVPLLWPWNPASPWPWRSSPC